MGNALAACLPESQDPALRDPSRITNGGGGSEQTSFAREFPGHEGSGAIQNTRGESTPSNPSSSNILPKHPPKPKKQTNDPPPADIAPPTPNSALVLTKAKPEEKKEKKTEPPRAPIKDVPSTKPKEEEEDVDYFQDMEPSYKKPTVIAKPVPTSPAKGPTQSRLSLAAADDWDEENGWGDD